MTTLHNTMPTNENQPARYVLSQDELTYFSAKVLNETPPVTTDRYIGYYLRGDTPESNLGRHIEREVFEAEFGNDAASMSKIYGHHEDASSLFVVVDQESVMPRGALRVTRHSDAGLVTLRDARELLGVTTDTFTTYHNVHDMENVWDIGTLAVPREYRSLEDHLISNILYRGMHARAMYEGVKHYISIIDAGARSTFDFIGFPFQPLAGTPEFSYEGSTASMAMYGDATTFASNVLDNYEKADESLKPFLRVYAARMAPGEGIDHRLVFDF